MLFSNISKGADQSKHQSSMLNIFDIHSLEKPVFRNMPCNTPRFLLIFVALEIFASPTIFEDNTHVFFF